MIRGADMISFPVHGDDRGSLVAVEAMRDVPFEIKRIYYIFGTRPDVVRGKHAHKDLNQVMLSVSGSCDLLLDNGEEKETVRLENPSEGVYIHGYVWREMLNFTPDCVLLVMVDRYYDPDDYEYDHGNVRQGGKEK